jgi:hypothetical protein
MRNSEFGIRKAGNSLMASVRRVCSSLLSHFSLGCFTSSFRHSPFAIRRSPSSIRNSQFAIRESRANSLGRESGVIFIWILVSFFVMAVLLIAGVQPASIMAKREKEAELVFRGEEYVEAIRSFQQEHGGAYPTKLKQLLEQGPKKHRYIRRLYKNPFDVEGKWILLGPGTTVVSKDDKGNTVYKSSGAPTGLPTNPATPPSTPPAVPGQQGGVGGQKPAAGGTSGQTNPGTPGMPKMGQVLPFRIGGQEGQPILGVYCKLHEKAFQDFLGNSYYDEWFFSPLVIPPPTLPGARPNPQQQKPPTTPK